MNARNFSLLAVVAAFGAVSCGSNDPSSTSTSGAGGATSGTGGTGAGTGGMGSSTGTGTGGTGTGGTGTGGGSGAVPCVDTPPPDGTLYRVSPQGDDQNDCTDANPCRTIQHAADIVDQPGSVILVDDGAYEGFQSVYDGITFRANGQNVVISSGNGGAQDNINIEGNDNVRIEGFIIRDAIRTGIRVVTGSNVTVKNNRIGPSGRWGILTGFAVGVRILNNETFDSGVEHGIYVGNSDSPQDNPWICGNDSHGNQGNGIQINGDCHAGGDGMIEGAILENNHVHDNHLKGLSMISAPTIRILNNIIRDNGITAGAGGIHLVTEPGCDTHATSNGIVANNTVVEPNIAAIRMNDGATGNVIFNNILISSNPAADEVGGNFISTDNLTQGDTTGLLFDATFKPAAGSTAIDKGVASYQGENAPGADILGMMRPLGAAFDMGAYEVQ